MAKYRSLRESGHRTPAMRKYLKRHNCKGKLRYAPQVGYATNRAYKSRYFDDN